MCDQTRVLIKENKRTRMKRVHLISNMVILKACLFFPSASSYSVLSMVGGGW